MPLKKLWLKRSVSNPIFSLQHQSTAILQQYISATEREAGSLIPSTIMTSYLSKILWRRHLWKTFLIYYWQSAELFQVALKGVSSSQRIPNSSDFSKQLCYLKGRRLNYGGIPLEPLFHWLMTKFRPCGKVIYTRRCAQSVPDLFQIWGRLQPTLFQYAGAGVSSFGHIILSVHLVSASWAAIQMYRGIGEGKDSVDTLQHSNLHP